MQKEVANKKIDELLHELPYYMNDFVIVKTADEYSPNTILEYLKNFHQFLIWLIENHYVNENKTSDIAPESLDKLTVRTATEYKSYLLRRKKQNKKALDKNGHKEESTETLSKVTIQRNITALKVIFKFLSRSANNSQEKPFLTHDVMQSIDNVADKQTLQARADALEEKLFLDDETDEYLQYIKEEKYQDSYKEFLQDIMAISRKYQKMILNQDVVGYQGVEGAFSHIACTHVFPEHKKQRYASFEDVFKAVVDGEIRYGIVPFENSYTGEVGEVLDLLIKYPVYVCKDYDLKISQNLLGIPGAKLEDIRQVYSKDQAIYQSKQFLEGRGYELIPYPNTALAAEYIAKQNDKKKAAIAAKENAERYGLAVLAEDINTSAQNTTRFIIIGRDLQPSGNIFSLAVIIPHKAGALVSAMNIIARHGFNMQSIISRSIKDRPWEYYFYVEIDGNIQKEQEQLLVQELKDVCEEVRILGAYTKESRDEK